MNKQQIINEPDLGQVIIGFMQQEASLRAEVSSEGLVGTHKNGIVGLSLDEMRTNTERAKAEFEKIEIKLNKVRQVKLQAVETDDREGVVSLSKEDTLLSQQLNSAYELWQTCKRNYEYDLPPFSRTQS